MKKSGRKKWQVDDVKYTGSAEGRLRCDGRWIFPLTVLRHFAVRPEGAKWAAVF